MKLQEYFNQQSRERLSDERKIELYQRICEKRVQSSRSLARSSILTKRLYAVFSVILVFVIFSMVFVGAPRVTEYRAFFTEKVPSGVNVASADAVAKILQINWDYIIEKEGKTFKNSVLFDGDIITLKDNAKIIFGINDGIKAEVQGPARFMISKVEEKYYLALIDWDYLKIDWEKDSDALQIETEDMIIETSGDEGVALELVKQDEKTELKNTWSSLLVKAKKNDVVVEEAKLEPESLLTMSNTNAIEITSIEDAKDFADVLSKKSNLAYTAEIDSTKKEETEIVITDEEKEILALATEDLDTSKNRETIDEETKWGIMEAISYEEDDVKVPTEAQLSKITAALNKWFLLSDMESLYNAKYDGDNDAIAAAYRNLSQRIKSVWEACNVSVAIETSPSRILAQIDQVQAGLANYYFPPARAEQLQVIRNWIQTMEKLVPSESWEIYVTHLPSNLIFK